LSIFVPLAIGFRRSPDDRPWYSRQLHVVFDDHGRDLWDFFVRAVGTPGKTVSVTADHNAVLQDHAIADCDALADGDVRMDDTVRADARARPNRDVRKDHRAIADHRAFAHRDKRADRRGGAYRRVGGHSGHGMNTGLRTPFRGKEPDGARKGEIGIARPQHCARRGGGVVFEDDRRGLRAPRTDSYFAFARKVRSPDRASSMPATRVISMSPSPSRRQASRSASSRNFT
jgi:hypothetical protein